MTLTIPRALWTRLRRYASEQGRATPEEAVIQILTERLDRLEQRRALIGQLNRRTPEQRSAAARKAVQARWAKANDDGVQARTEGADEGRSGAADRFCRR